MSHKQFVWTLRTETPAPIQVLCYGSAEDRAYDVCDAEHGGYDACVDCGHQYESHS